MRAVVAAEWLKLRSVRSTWWLVGGTVLLTALLAPLEADAAVKETATGLIETEASALTVAGWVTFVLGALGMLAMTSEYATRSIMVTLACTPSRPRLLLAKTAVVGGAVFAVGVLTAALALAAAVPVLGDRGDFDFVRVAGTVLAIGAQLALIAVLALGLGTLIRRSAGTLTVLFVLLLILPNVLTELGDALHIDFLGTVAGYTPSPAGSRFMDGEPEYGLVVAAWSLAALAAGVHALKARDA